MILRRYVDDDLFIDLIDKTMFDYSVDIEPLMLEEYERKKKKDELDYKENKVSRV